MNLAIAFRPKLVDALKSSFDFCSSSLAKVDDSNLGEPMTLFGERKEIGGWNWFEMCRLRPHRDRIRRRAVS